MNKVTALQNWYNRWEGTIQILVVVLLPLIVYLYGSAVSRSIERTKTDQEYVRIATGILAQKVKEEDDQTPIRTWAAEILMKYSPTQMTDEQKRKLISGDSRLSPIGVGDYWGYGGDYYIGPVDRKAGPNSSVQDNR